MTEEDIKKLQSTGGDALAATEKNILGNHLHKLADHVMTIKNGRIDFVLDNAGFELYCDLVYADWLIQSGTADKIIFHGKKIPWFVSDVTKKDWDWWVRTNSKFLISTGFSILVYTGTCSPKRLRKRWILYESWAGDGSNTRKRANGSTRPIPSGALVTPSYVLHLGRGRKLILLQWDIHSEAPDLFQYLSESNLVIFKGDLNHRMSLMIDFGLLPR